MAPNLAGKICLVTGASRGIGRGIALQLGKAGATVYITGRKLPDLEKCVEEMKGLGASSVIPLQVDHNKDDEVKNLFEKIKNEHNGKLDVLVNNAYAAVNHIMDNTGKKFWEIEPCYSWDIVNGVGLRNHFICSTYAARMMIENKSGLIVNVSSFGGLKYLFHIPYGVGKAALDRMAADCAHELRKHNVTVVSLWPGPVQTEEIKKQVLENADTTAASKSLWADGETTNFAGLAVANLANDGNHIAKTGKILYTVDLAYEYKFTEEDGSMPGDALSLKNVLTKMKYTTTAALVPSFMRTPKFLLHMGSFKF